VTTTSTIDASRSGRNRPIAGTSEALDAKGSRNKVGVVDPDGASVAVRPARQLTQDPVFSARSGKDDRGTNLGRREIGERKRDER
jgi:hypothetical protein